MLEQRKVEARIISAICAIALLGFAASGNCETQAKEPKGQEPAATEAAKTADPRTPQITEKPKKDTDPAVDRQKQLADDTAKLLLLANELKAEMDKSTKDTLSLSVVKKAEEVEKLARKVRDEMKKSIGN
jgi:hypothetical protein